MTGGSAGIAVDGGRIKVTQGFELHCGTPPSEPNNLEINWPGHRFHLDTLSSAFCYDAPGIGPAPPVAAFDTMIGQGTGSLDGVPGAKISFTFADAGEPGTSDTIAIKINGGAALNVSGSLWSGNLQAH